MNDRISELTVAASLLTPEAVDDARAMAAALGRPLLDVLEEQSSLLPREFASVLALTFGMGYLSQEALEQATPDFERLPYAEASRRGCIFHSLSFRW